METSIKYSSLEGKVALVTGSTGSIGFRIAETLAARGARVALNGRRIPEGLAAVERLAYTRAEVIYEQGDAAKYSEISDVVSRVQSRLGPIDILVSSGGQDTPGPTLFHEFKPEDFLRTFEVRFLPRIFPVHAVLPSMRKRESGSIVLISTDAARFPTSGESMIGAAGAAILLMNKALARELSRWKIRVNCVALTLTSDTARYDDIFSSPGLANKVFSKALTRFPFGAPPTASEVASVAAFLASSDAAQVTGQTISVNGGLSFGGW